MKSCKRVDKRRISPVIAGFIDMTSHTQVVSGSIEVEDPHFDTQVIRPTDRGYLSPNGAFSQAEQRVFIQLLCDA